jgi:hypothetical protein
MLCESTLNGLHPESPGLVGDPVRGDVVPDDQTMTLLVPNFQVPLDVSFARVTDVGAADVPPVTGVRDDVTSCDQKLHAALNLADGEGRPLTLDAATADGHLPSVLYQEAVMSRFPGWKE